MRIRLAVILFLASYQPSISAEIPIGSPVTENVFRVTRELYGRNILARYEYSTPGELTSAARGRFLNNLCDHFKQLSQGYSKSVRIPLISATCLAVESNHQSSSNHNFLKLFPFTRIDFTPKLSATVLYRIDGELDNDPRYDGKSWKGIAGFPENATIDYKADNFGARFGIERLSWGFGRYDNLMFSRAAMPITLIGISYNRGIFNFQAIAGFLNPLKDQLDKMEDDTSFFTSQQRYIAAHSISIKPFSGFSFSLREAVLYGGPGRRFEPVYMIPLLWFHGQQLNNRLDDNILSSVGADYRYAGKIWLYGEVLVDDFQAEKKTRGDYEPNQLGFLVGAELYDLITGGTTLAVEYARINNWTFNQARAHNRYINDNYPIGFQDGPDVDIIDWTLSYWILRDMKVTYNGSYRRHGEGRIDTPWTRPWLDVAHYSEPFPTGEIERKTVNGLDVLVINKNQIWGNLKLKYTDINNEKNIPGNSSRGWELQVDIGIKMPPFSRGL